MAQIIDDISRTFREFLLLPGLTTAEHVPANVNLRIPIQKLPLKDLGKSDSSALHLTIPIVSAAMQAVSGSELAIALARKGGMAFIFCSQSVESQAEMVRQVKEHKAGFVESDSNLPPTATLHDAVTLRRRTGHSTIAITKDGGSHAPLLGLLTSKDFWEFKDDLSRPVSEFYTPVDRLVMAEEGISLQDATEKLWKHKKECLPIVDRKGNLKALVFRRDYFDHKSNPDELTDHNKQLCVGAALNTHDYKVRAKALVEAGADCFVMDSSDGHSEWQAQAAKWLRKEFGKSLVLGGGNVVTAEGFRYLVEEAGLDFVKIGIGGGSICITREQKGIGRGQASSVLEIANERDKYAIESGVYVPICSDGAINTDTDLILALAMGADFVMMGKYFASLEESPTEKIRFRGQIYKPYWGEGSNRARNWERYKQSEKQELIFEEGVDAYVPFSGRLSEKVGVTVAKLKSSMCNCGVLSLKQFHRDARLTRVSELAIIEGGTTTVQQLERMQMDRN